MRNWETRTDRRVDPLHVTNLEVQKQGARIEGFVPPWPWPDHRPEGWTERLSYLNFPMYCKLSREVQVLRYERYFRVQRDMQADWSVAAARIKLEETKGLLGSTSSAQKLREEKSLLESQLQAITGITNNMRFYRVWRRSNSPKTRE
jgi:hypothetical protein